MRKVHLNLETGSIPFFLPKHSERAVSRWDRQALERGYFSHNLGPNRGQEGIFTGRGLVMVA